jgi:hypothetical protein
MKIVSFIYKQINLVEQVKFCINFKKKRFLACNNIFNTPKKEKKRKKQIRKESLLQALK